MQVNLNTSVNQSPNFSSKVQLAHDTAEFFSRNKSMISRYSKQIKALERNGVKDTVQISSYEGVRTALDDTEYGWPEMRISVIKKVGSKLYQGIAYDGLIGADTGKKLTKKAMKEKGLVDDTFQRTPNLLKLYDEAVANMEEVKIVPSMQKLFKS